MGLPGTDEGPMIRSGGEGSRRVLGIPPAVLLAVVLILTVTVRLAFTFGYVRGVLHDLPEDQVNDGYDSLAENLLRGEGYRIHLSHPPTMERPPAYPLLIYLVFKTVGLNYAAVQVAHALLGGLCGLFLFLLGRWALGAGTGLTAATLFALYPNSIQYSANICSENLFFPLVAGLAYALCRSVWEQSWKWGLTAGLFWGLANLTRGTLLPFPVVLVPALLLMPAVRETWRQWPRWAVPALLGTLLVMSPWVVRNYNLSGAFVPVSTWGWAPFYHGLQCSKKMLQERDLRLIDRAASRERHELVVERLYGGDKSRAFDSPRDYVRHDQIARDLVLSELRGDPWGAFKRTLRGIPLSWFQTLGPGRRALSALVHLPLLLLTILGAVRLARGRARAFRRLWPALVMVAFVNVFTAFVFPYIRYMAPVIAVAMVYASYELVSWARVLNDRWGSRGLKSP